MRSVELSKNFKNDNKRKQLLLNDISARLPYGLKCCARYNTGSRYNTNIITVVPENGSIVTRQNELHYQTSSRVEDCRPYLRPLSSMTEEKQYILNTWCEEDYNNGIDIMYDNYMLLSCASDFIDWLNAHHFDYRIDPSTGKTLIESGLAIEAPEDMYETE